MQEEEQEELELAEIAKVIMAFGVAMLVATVAQCRRLRAKLAARWRRRRRRAMGWLVARRGRARCALRAVIARMRFWGWYLQRRYRVCCFWVLHARKDWRENDVLRLWSDEQWLANFCMTRGTFVEIVAELWPLLERRVTVMHRPIPIEKRVAIGIWRLATPCVQRMAATQFGVGCSMAAQIVLDVCFALESRLLSRLIHLGDVREVSGPEGGQRGRGGDEGAHGRPSAPITGRRGTLLAEGRG